MTVRVATLNLWNKTGPWQERMALVKETIADLKPDLVGLQEVLELQSNGKVQNQVTEVCADLEWAYGVGHEMTGPWVPTGGRLAFGNALLSRHPIRESETLPLPGADRSDQRRSLLHAVVDAPVGRIDVFVTHLNWKLDEGWIRELQVKAIAQAVEERADATDFPPILMGDMNAVPDSDEMRFLRGFTRLGEERSVRFADAWEYVPHKGDGHTFDGVNNPYATVYHEPPRRLDYIFVRGPNHGGEGKPLDVSLAFDQPKDGILCSDHFGVFAELSAG